MLDVYPENCRLLIKNGNVTTVVIEQKPQIRSIAVRSDYSECSDYSHKCLLSFPFVIFIIKLGSNNRLINIKVAYKNSPISSVDDEIYRSNLSNYIGGLNMCMGHVRLPPGDLNQKVKALISHFWFSEWSGPLTFIPGIDGLEDWESKTKTNPMFILKIDWVKFGPLKKCITIPSTKIISIADVNNIIRKIKNVESRKEARKALKKELKKELKNA